MFHIIHCIKKWNFPLRISSVNMTKIRSFLRIWSHLLNKSSMENFIFCAVSLGIFESHHSEVNYYQIIFQRNNCWMESLLENCPNTEFFLVHIFQYSDWIRRFTDQSPYLVRIRENTDQRKFSIWTLFTLVGEPIL